MSNKPFFDTEIPISEFPSNYIPTDAEIYTAVTYGNGEDFTCVANFIKKNGVIHFQEITFYNREGKIVCPLLK